MLTPEQIADGWKPWELGSVAAPVAPDTWVAVLFRGPPDPEKGELRTHGFARQMAWWHDGAEDDIIAYRPEQPHD